MFYNLKNMYVMMLINANWKRTKINKFFLVHYEFQHSPGSDLIRQLFTERALSVTMEVIN